MVDIKLSEITLSALNPRKHSDETKLKELAASIKEKGVIVPVIVRQLNGKYELVCGERRYRASKSIGLETIPANIKQLNDVQVLEYQVIENQQREDICPLEEAEGYEALLKKRGIKTIDDLAVSISKSKSYIRGRLKLCELIPENRKLFYEGKFSPSVALLVARVPAHLQKDAGHRAAFGEYRGDDPMSFREAKEYIHEHFMLQLKEAQFDTKKKGLAGKEACLECLKRTGNQKELFEEVTGADVCTDPVCFEAKKNAHTQSTIAQLKAQGKEVVSWDEAKKLFRSSNDNSPEHKYVSLDERNYSGKYETLRPLVKACKDVKVTYAVQPFNGKIIEMVEKTGVPKILKSAGIKVNANDRGSSKDLVKAKTDNRVRAAKRGFWISKVSTAKDRRCMNVIILDILLDDMGWSESAEIVKGKMKSHGGGRAYDIPALYNLGDDEVQKLITKVISKKPDVLWDKDLEFLSDKLGFNMAKDYAITENYLQACTKDQLGALARELKIDIGMIGTVEDKKSALVAFVLKHAPKGKVPKELANEKK
jgi:ParB/RepB/Spo0J family partition protein